MKNILIAVTGLSPQVVTETIHALYKEMGIKINEVICITTDEGKKKILEYEKKDNINGTTISNHSLKVEIEKMCEELKIEVPIFNLDTNVIVTNEESLQVPDVIDNADNKLFANLVCKVIKDLSLDNNVTLYCSLSGGRKTMSAYMYAAISLFGRENDKLYHVLVDNKFEKSGKFYPTMEFEKIKLSEVPFFKLRAIVPNIFDMNLSYSELVEETQKWIEDANYGKLILNVKLGTIEYCGKREKIEKGLMYLYAAFVRSKIEDRKGFSWKEVGYDEYQKIHKGKLLHELKFSEEEIQSFRETPLVLAYAMLKEYALVNNSEIPKLLDPKDFSSLNGDVRHEDLHMKWWNSGKTMKNFNSDKSDIKNCLLKLFRQYESNETKVEELVNMFEIFKDGKKDKSFYYIHADKHLLKIV